MFDKIKTFFNNIIGKKLNGKIKYIIVGVLAIIVILIFASSFIPQTNTESKGQNSAQTYFTALEYCNEVENRLVNILEQVKGISNVNVYVVVEASPTIKYLEEVKTEESGGQNKVYSTENTIVFSKDGTVTTPVMVVEMLPKITGVLIVAKGASDVKIKTSLINVVSSVIGVSVSKVEVLEGK